MCELVQRRGSSVLESLAVKTLTKLFFYVNVAAAASDRRLLKQNSMEPSCMVHSILDCFYTV